MSDELQQDIAEPDPQRFPYGAKITIFLNREIQFDIKRRLFGFGENLTMKFVENKTNTSKYQEVALPGFQVWDVLLDGFQTAVEAENAGLKLAQSFLWLSISRNFPIRLIHNKPLPCTVYDRTKGPSIEMVGFGHQTQKEIPERIIDEVKNAFFSEHIPDVDRERILLAMEIYSSSQLEVTERAKFISLVTSLEALSAQQSYKEYCKLVQEKVRDLITAIRNEKCIPDNTKNSLADRICREMNIESVRQAILRVIMGLLQDIAYKKLFEKAYDARSALLHDGKTDENLYELTQDTSLMIRKVMSACLGLQLSRE
jgi:hypothetical protein